MEQHPELDTDGRLTDERNSEGQFPPPKPQRTPRPRPGQNYAQNLEGPASAASAESGESGESGEPAGRVKDLVKSFADKPLMVNQIYKKSPSVEKGDVVEEPCASGGTTKQPMPAGFVNIGPASQDATDVTKVQVDESRVDLSGLTPEQLMKRYQGLSELRAQETIKHKENGNPQSKIIITVSGQHMQRIKAGLQKTAEGQKILFDLASAEAEPRTPEPKNKKGSPVSWFTKL